MALFYDTVPDTWVARAYPSMMGLAAWFADLLLRIRVRTVCTGHRRPAPPPKASGTVAERGVGRGGRGPRQRPPPAWPVSQQGWKGAAHTTQTPDSAGASCSGEETAGPRREQLP